MSVASQQQQRPLSRKRSKESVSSSQSDVPTAKKKKMASRDRAPADPTKHLSSPTPSPSLTQQDETEKLGGVSPAHQEEGAGVASPAATVTAAKKKVPKNHYLKPQRLSPGSWMTHMASLLVHRCAQKAESCGLDPRAHLSEINWSQMVQGLLLPRDLHLIWYFIRREYTERALPEILEATRPYSEISVETFIREEIRIKYKDAIPKVPLSPYMLFMKSKQPKLKQKYPNLQMTEVATKIGKKWSALPDEKKEKYKQQHALMKVSYEAELKSFYDEHPDARPPPKQSATSKSKKASKSSAAAYLETEEEKRIKELKVQQPKQPLSGYLHFCKKKREKLHRKHPELAPNAVTVKLGKRWKSMDTEARSKYMKLNVESVRVYKEELARFNTAHPEAQELLARARRMKGKRGNAKVTAKQQQTISVREDGKITAVLPPVVSTSLSQPTAAVVPAGEREEKEEEEEEEDEEVEGEGEVEEEEQQNGRPHEQESDSDSSTSSTED